MRTQICVRDCDRRVDRDCQTRTPTGPVAPHVSSGPVGGAFRENRSRRRCPAGSRAATSAGVPATTAALRPVTELHIRHDTHLVKTTISQALTKRTHISAVATAPKCLPHFSFKPDTTETDDFRTDTNWRSGQRLSHPHKCSASRPLTSSSSPTRQLQGFPAVPRHSKRI